MNTIWRVKYLDKWQKSVATAISVIIHAISFPSSDDDQGISLFKTLLLKGLKNDEFWIWMFGDIE